MLKKLIQFSARCMLVLYMWQINWTIVWSILYYSTILVVMWDYSWTLSKIQVIYSATTVYTPGNSVMAHLPCPNEITPMRKYLGVVLIEQGFMRGPPESPLQLSLPTSPPAQMCCSVIWTADLYSAAHRLCGITGTLSDIITLLYFSFSVNIQVLLQ